jgi:hypothetical protein
MNLQRQYRYAEGRGRCHTILTQKTSYGTVEMTAAQDFRRHGLIPIVPFRWSSTLTLGCRFKLEGKR